MDLKYTPEEEAFRAQVRDFLEAELPADIRSRMNLGKRFRSGRSGPIPAHLRRTRFR